MADEHQDELRAIFAEMLGTSKYAPDSEQRARAARESEWFKVMYETRRSLFEGDLSRQWGILQLFIPLSLTPFAGVLIADRLGALEVGFLGAASVLLQVAGNLHSERMSRLSERTWRWVQAAEAEVGLPRRPPQLKGRRADLSLRALSWWMVAATTALWVALLAVVSSVE